MSPRPFTRDGSLPKITNAQEYYQRVEQNAGVRSKSPIKFDSEKKFVVKNSKPSRDEDFYYEIEGRNAIRPNADIETLPDLDLTVK